MSERVGDMSTPSLDEMFASLQAQADEKRRQLASRRERVARATRAAQLMKNDAVLAALRREQEGLAQLERELAEIELLLTEPAVTEPAARPEPAPAPVLLTIPEPVRAPDPVRPPEPVVQKSEPFAPIREKPFPLETRLTPEKPPVPEKRRPGRPRKVLPTVAPIAGKLGEPTALIQPEPVQPPVQPPVLIEPPVLVEPASPTSTPEPDREIEPVSLPGVSTRPVETAAPTWTAPERYESRGALPSPPAPGAGSGERRAAAPLLAIETDGTDPEAAATLARLVEAAETRPRYIRQVGDPVRSLVELETYLEELDGWLLRQCTGGELGLLEFRARLAEFRQAAKERKLYGGDLLLWNEELKVFLGKRGQFWPDVRMDELDWRNELPRVLWEGRAAGYRRIGPAVEALLWIETQLENSAGTDGPVAISRAELTPVVESAAAAIVLFQRFLEQGAELSDSGIRLWLRRAQSCADTLDVRLSSLKPYATDPALEHLATRLPERFAAAEASEREVRVLTAAWEELDELVSRPGFGRTATEVHQFHAAIRNLRALGVPAADVRLRNSASHLHDLLDGVEETALVEVRREWHLAMRRSAEREKTSPRPNPGSQKAAESLSEEMQRKLTELRPHLEGRLVAMFGGLPDKRRKTLESLFGLKELRWPASDPNWAIERFAREMGKPGIQMVWINKWNSCHIGEFKKLAAELGLPIVLFNKGLGVTQVIETLYDHLILHPVRRGLAGKAVLAA